MEPDKDNRCKEAKEDDGDVTFNISNPCYNKTFENCEPLYFTIFLSPSSALHNCIGQLIDKNCFLSNLITFYPI